MQARLAKIGSLTVEQIQGVDYGALDASAAAHPKAVQHTTEGGFEGSLAKLRHVDSPNFLLGRDQTGRIRCVQLVQVGRVAGALEHPAGTPQTNGLAMVQVELVGYSRKTVWLPDAGVTDALAHLYAVVSKEYGVPLQHVSNLKRDRKVYADGSGWFGHADIPDQPAGHWDPGNLDYAALFKQAKVLATNPPWYQAAVKQSPLWAWIAWRDNGAPAHLRPVNVPARVPASWWLRLKLHRGL